MATVTDFHCTDEGGLRVLCDAHGNNVAFRCQGCGGPVLAVIREHQRGSHPDNPPNVVLVTRGIGLNWMPPIHD